MSRSAASDLDKELTAGGSSVSPDSLDRTSTGLNLLKDNMEEKALEWEDEELQQVLRSLDELKVEHSKKKDTREETADLQQILQELAEGGGSLSDSSEDDEELKGLKQDIKSLVKEIQEVEEMGKGLLKEEVEAIELAEGLKKRMEKERQLDEDLRKQDEYYAQLMEKIAEQKRELQEYSVYTEIMERLLPMTEFKDVGQLADHFESIINNKAELTKEWAKLSRQLNKEDKALLSLVQRNKLVEARFLLVKEKLQRELDKELAEVASLKATHDQLQATASKGTLKLAKYKISIFQMYDKIRKYDTQVEGVDKLDTEKQLERIQKFHEVFGKVPKPHQNAEKDEELEEEEEEEEEKDKKDKKKKKQNKKNNNNKNKKNKNARHFK